MSLSRPTYAPSLAPEARLLWNRVREVTALEVILHLGEIILILNIWNRLEARYTYVGYGLLAYLGVCVVTGIVKLLPVTTPYLRRWMWERQNPLRWVEYFVSSGIMVLVVGWLVGLTGFWTLTGLFLLNAAMISTGYFIETRRGHQHMWYLLGTGCFATVWVILGLACRNYMQTNGLASGLPFIIAFWLFCTFGINMWLAIQKIGWYKNYYWVEISYTLLSILSKSALVWVIWYLLQTT